MALLEAFKSSVLQAFQSYPFCSGTAGTPEDCFSTLISASIPSLVAFPVAVLGIVFGGLYGLYFEFIPGEGTASGPWQREWGCSSSCSSSALPVTRLTGLRAR